MMQHQLINLSKQLGHICYMCYGHVLVLPSRGLVCTAAEDDFVICRNARMDMCLCYHVEN